MCTATSGLTTSFSIPPKTEVCMGGCASCSVIRTIATYRSGCRAGLGVVHAGPPHRRCCVPCRVLQSSPCVHVQSDLAYNLMNFHLPPDAKVAQSLFSVWTVCWCSLVTCCLAALSWIPGRRCQQARSSLPPPFLKLDALLIASVYQASPRRGSTSKRTTASASCW